LREEARLERKFSQAHVDYKAEVRNTVMKMKQVNEMTEELFRDDAYLQQHEATVTALSDGGIELDGTVFYATGGGQPGDTGILLTDGGRQISIIDTIKDRSSGALLHVPAQDAAMPAVGDRVTAIINWQRRHRHMRMHTGLHLLCSLIDGAVTGGSIGAEKGRLDFDLGDTVLDKRVLTADLNRLIAEDHPVTSSWISDDALAANPEMIRTMSVKPPTGQGRVRLIKVGSIDLQPCGGTHVESTGEIGQVRVGKIENKGKHNRRVNVLFDDAA